MQIPPSAALSRVRHLNGVAALPVASRGRADVDRRPGAGEYCLRAARGQRPAALEPGRDVTTMEMKRLTGGNLRAAGYDEQRRVLTVELASGTFEYAGVSADTYRRLMASSSPWSFYRDHIDEEFPAKRVR
jgi:hypothetical protein